jgi:hypothetical protein
MLRSIINEYRRDPFAQKWLKGPRFKMVAIIYILALSFSLVLLQRQHPNYPDWSSYSVIQPILGLWFIFMLPFLVKWLLRIQSIPVRVLALTALLVPALIFSVVLGLYIAVLDSSTGEAGSTFTKLLVVGFGFSFIYPIYLAYRAGRRYSVD